ncbi:hypothetical protein KR018_011195 [Drosophila ironensis]|nr:hypothetical protein KR018_011195 [Drosophila ironensis]
MNYLRFLSCILLWSSVQAAFQDFVIGPEHYQGDTNLELREEAYEGEDMGDDELISFHDVQHDGIVDTDLLMKALLQHAKRFGMTLEELANLHISEDDEGMNHLGCDASPDLLSYRDRPTWRDVFFH